jgi:hypothetical protein
MTSNWAWVRVRGVEFLVRNPRPEQPWTVASLATHLSKMLPVLVRQQDIIVRSNGLVWSSDDPGLSLDLDVDDSGFLRVLHKGGRWVANPLPAKGAVLGPREIESAMQIRAGPMWVVLKVPVACAPGRSLCYRLALAVLGSASEADSARKSKGFRGSFSVSPQRLVFTPLHHKIVQALRTNLFVAPDGCPLFLQDYTDRTARVWTDKVLGTDVIVTDAQLIVDQDMSAAYLKKIQDASALAALPVLRFAHGFNEPVRDCLRWLEVLATALRHSGEPASVVLEELGHLSAKELDTELGVLPVRKQ